MSESHSFLTHVLPLQGTDYQFYILQNGSLVLYSLYRSSPIQVYSNVADVVSFTYSALKKEIWLLQMEMAQSRINVSRLSWDKIYEDQVSGDCVSACPVYTYTDPDLLFCGACLA